MNAKIVYHDDPLEFEERLNLAIIEITHSKYGRIESIQYETTSITDAAGYAFSALILWKKG